MFQNAPAPASSFAEPLGWSVRILCFCFISSFSPCRDIFACAVCPFCYCTLPPAHAVLGAYLYFCVCYKCPQTFIIVCIVRLYHRSGRNVCQFPQIILTAETTNSSINCFDVAPAGIYSRYRSGNLNIYFRYIRPFPVHVNIVV